MDKSLEGFGPERLKEFGTTEATYHAHMQKLLSF